MFGWLRGRRQSAEHNPAVCDWRCRRHWRRVRWKGDRAVIAAGLALVYRWRGRLN